MVTVSVLTPSFAYGQFIADAVQSVLLQRGVSVEHIVQDSQSQDQTVEVLQRFGGAVDWRSERDAGQSDALNRALERANGRWIGWLNADEFYLPASLSQLIKVGEAFERDVVFGDAAFVDAQGCLTRLLPQHTFNLTLLRHYGPFIPSCAVVIRRAFLDVAPWDERLRKVMDWDLYLSLAEQGARFAHVSYPVGAFRIHGMQVTARPAEDFVDDYRILSKKHSIPFVFGRQLARPWFRGPARTAHGFYKLFAGAYMRQLAARELRGRDLRWFRREIGPGGVNEMLRRCYGLHRACGKYVRDPAES